MSTPSPISLQWKTTGDLQWHSLAINDLPVSRPVKIRIETAQGIEMTQVQSLVDRIRKVVSDVGGRVDNDGLQDLIEPETDAVSVMEVIVCDGVKAVAKNARADAALKRSLSAHAWVLPVMPKSGDPATLPESLRKQNIAFWQHSIDELALTVLGRAGVTSLDRRVFISYRRIESEPMAGQLFDALARLNFNVFLDTVSVDAGVDFQDRLFEQLADKSMIVLLHSETFSQSRWTMAEVEYARRHELSVLIYRLPCVAARDPLEQSYRAGDVRKLREPEHVKRMNEKSPWSLTAPALEKMLAEITACHDREMIARLVRLRRRTVKALKRYRVTNRLSSFGASIHVTSPSGKTWSLFPTPRPPGVPELFDASNYDQDVGDQRVVVGNVNSFHSTRRSQLDWVVDGRNVIYVDVHNLDTWIRDYVLKPAASVIP